MSSKLPDYIHITSDISTQLPEVVKALNPDKIGLLVDENTKKYCLPHLSLQPDILIEIPSGETNKNLQTCTTIWGYLTKAAFTRKSLLINLGGGVIGDMGGFAASTYKRGISFINVPTTLLSQVDASIGGKLGIDFEGLKNHIGVFKEPYAVIIDPVFLETLPERELLSGYAEVIKHALIFDAEHWENLKATPIHQHDWRAIIEKSVSIKSAVVESDPYEQGLRKILNFGHTLGHAIESYLLETDNRLLHGEAIAIGMILEGHLSVQLGVLSEEELNAVSAYIRSIYTLPASLPQYGDLLTLLLQDKKNSNSVISFSLLEEIGKCAFDQTVTSAQIEKSIEAYAK